MASSVVLKYSWRSWWHNGRGARSAALGHGLAGAVPEHARVVPVSVQGQHLGDDRLDGVLFLNDAREVAQVLLALVYRAGGVGGADPLVSRHDGRRAEGGDRVQAGDPGLAGGGVGIGGHHV